MDDTKAEEMLRELAEHYGEPVRRVSDYCNAFMDWARVLAERGKEDDYEAAHYGEIANKLASVQLPIVKSNYLARRIYVGETHRTEKCPTHKGHWSGCYPEPCPDGCTSGMDVTGWLPARHDYKVFTGKLRDLIHSTKNDISDEHILELLDHDPYTRCTECGATEDALVHQVENGKEKLA
jgi:hypothetical protein